MNFDELMRRVLDIMPDAIFSEDSENEIIISTGLMSVSLNEELVPVNKENI